MRLRVSFDEDGERTELLARLGLPADASEEDLTAALGERITAEETGVEPPPPADPPADPPPAEQPAAAGEGEGETDEEEDDLDDEDTVVVDVAAWRAVNERASLAARLQEEDRINTRNTLIEAAIRDGRFPPSRRDHYIARYESDPEGTTRLLSRMLPNTVPLEERGHDVSEDDQERSDTYPADWAPEVAARATRNGGHEAQGENGTGRRTLSSRVTTEEA